MVSEKRFMRSMNKLEKLGYESISHRLFEGMRHDVLMEKNSINVYKDIAKTLFSWLDRWNDRRAEEMPAEPAVQAEAEAETAENEE